MHRVRGVVLVEGSKRLKLGNLLQPHHKFLVASKTPKVQQKIEKPTTSTLFSFIKTRARGPCAQKCHKSPFHGLFMDFWADFFLYRG